MTSQKVFVTNDQHAVITCQVCKKIKRVDVGKFRGVKHAIAVKCPCGNRFSGEIDFRLKFCKPLPDHEGIFAIIPPGFKWHSMVVKNVSMEGIGFVSPF